MGKTERKTVLFLCTGNYHRSRFAEIVFNAAAERMALSWRASSRGLALERGAGNIGPMAASALRCLEKRGLASCPAAARLPAAATVADFEEADHIIVLKQAEHEPLLQERFPAWWQRVEYWHVDDVPEALPVIDQEVIALVERLRCIT